MPNICITNDDSGDTDFNAENKVRRNRLGKYLQHLCQGTDFQYTYANLYFVNT